jgi:hypothetical protein
LRCRQTVSRFYANRQARNRLAPIGRARGFEGKNYA